MARVTGTQNAKGLAKVLSHPLRLSVLQILGERVASPNEMAAQLGEGLSSVSYHVKVLCDYECIELVKTEPRRGVIEHYYRAIKRGEHSDEEFASLSQEAREEISAITSRELVLQLFSAQQEGTLDRRTDRHLSWAPMTLDEEGFSELLELLASTLEASFEIEAKSAARRASTGDAGKSAVIGLMGFEMPSRSNA